MLDSHRQATEQTPATNRPIHDGARVSPGTVEAQCRQCIHGRVRFGDSRIQHVKAFEWRYFTAFE